MTIARLGVIVVFAAGTLCGQSVVVGSGYAAPGAINVAPGQLITFFVTGMGAGITSRVAATTLPLPSTLADISVIIDELSDPPLRNERVPLLAVSRSGDVTAVTVQILFGLRTSRFISPLIPPPATMTIYEKGAAVLTIPIAPSADQIHIATSCDVNLATPVPGALCRPVVAHADGSPVTPDRPARAGEQIVLYAFGLGATTPGLAAGDASPAPAQLAAGTLTLTAEPAIPTLPGERRVFAPVFAGLTPGFAGLYQVNLIAPAPPVPFAPADCTTFNSPNGNVAVTLRGTSFDTASICVMP